MRTFESSVALELFASSLKLQFFETLRNRTVQSSLHGYIVALLVSSTRCSSCKWLKTFHFATYVKYATAGPQKLFFVVFGEVRPPILNPTKINVTKGPPSYRKFTSEMSSQTLQTAISIYAFKLRLLYRIGTHPGTEAHP